MMPNFNCTFCTFHISDVRKCALYNKPTSTVQDPNNCEHFESTPGNLRRRFWQMLTFVFITFAFLSLFLYTISQLSQ